MCGTTCFGRLPAHHQEHTTALAAFGFTLKELLFVVWQVKPSKATTNNSPTACL
jgi:hypothetical protein